LRMMSRKNKSWAIRGKSEIKENEKLQESIAVSVYMVVSYIIEEKLSDDRLGRKVKKN